MSQFVVERLSEALRAHVDARRRAEERLAAFAFSERPGPGPSSGGDTETGRDADAADAVTAENADADRRYFVARTLRCAGDPPTLRLLAALRDGAVATAGLSDVLADDGRGRLAIIDRIGDLAAAGLVARELERDEVSLTPLGAAVVDLVAEIESRAGADAS